MTATKLYWGLGLVFVLSAAAAMLLPVTDVVRSLSALPAVIALFGALFQLGRDRIAHERTMYVSDLQNRFTVGAMSHMATVAFDKHVAFSEEYVSEMFQTLSILFQEGPSEGALNGATALSAIRRKWALWITPEMEAKLESFEKALRSIGSNAHLVERTSGGHPTAVKKMYEEFVKVMGSKIMGSNKWEDKQISEDVAIHTIIAALRTSLGIEELTKLRSSLVSHSSKLQL